MRFTFLLSIVALLQSLQSASACLRSGIGHGGGCAPPFTCCAAGLSCHPWIHKCYNYPRHINEPCVAGHPCLSWLSCEAGSHICRGGGKVGDPCHATRPCSSGLSCAPGVQKCYNSPRQVDQPCSLGFPCANGLNCEAGAQTCRAPGKVGEACHATRPCGGGLSCQPGVQKCYDSPRKEGQPCVAGHPCGAGLHCEAGTQTCKKPGEYQEPCHATRPCRSGLTCAPGVHKCYNSPRLIGEPCSLGFECKEGFYCESFLQVCMSKKFDPKAKKECAIAYAKPFSEQAKKDRKATTIGSIYTTAATVVTSAEYGWAYGPNGEFGCYRTTCIGMLTDVSVSVGFAITEFNKWDDVAGKSRVVGGGFGFPFIEGGYSAGLVFTEDGKTRIGFTWSLTVGVGLLPAQGGYTSCDTVLVAITAEELRTGVFKQDP